jgi:predicted RecB family nuclease
MSKNLTQIEGITAAFAKELSDGGINTIDQLASSAPKEISRVVGISIQLAEKWIAKASKFSDKLREEKNEPIVPPGEKMTSGYSMKTTTKRDMEENKDAEKP